MLYSRDWQNVVNQLYFNKERKKCPSKHYLYYLLPVSSLVLIYCIFSDVFIHPRLINLLLSSFDIHVLSSSDFSSICDVDNLGLLSLFFLDSMTRDLSILANFSKNQLLVLSNAFLFSIPIICGIHFYYFFSSAYFRLNLLYIL